MPKLVCLANFQLHGPYVQMQSDKRVVCISVEKSKSKISGQCFEILFCLFVCLRQEFLQSIAVGDVEIPGERYFLICFTTAVITAVRELSGRIFPVLRALAILLAVMLQLSLFVVHKIF